MFLSSWSFVFGICPCDTKNVFITGTSGHLQKQGNSRTCFQLAASAVNARSGVLGPCPPAAPQSVSIARAVGISVSGAEQRWAQLPRVRMPRAPCRWLGGLARWVLALQVVRDGPREPASGRSPQRTRAAPLTLQARLLHVPVGFEGTVWPLSPVGTGSSSACVSRSPPSCASSTLS